MASKKIMEFVLPPDEEEGMNAIALVDDPATGVEMQYFKRQETVKDCFSGLDQLCEEMGRDKAFKNSYRRKDKYFSTEDLFLMDKILRPWFRNGENVFDFAGEHKFSREDYVIEGSKQLCFVSEERRLVMAPVMIPDKLILRVDPETKEEYYGFFSADTISTMQERYAKNLLINNSNLMHDSTLPTSVVMKESWIVEDPKADKSAFFGFSMPKGTWMTVLKVLDDVTWSMVKNRVLKGLSLQGMFDTKFVRWQ